MSERTEVSFDAALMMALRADAQKELDELPSPAQLKERYPDTSRWDARLQAALHKRRPVLKRVLIAVLTLVILTLGALAVSAEFRRAVYTMIQKFLPIEMQLTYQMDGEPLEQLPNGYSDHYVPDGFERDYEQGYDNEISFLHAYVDANDKSIFYYVDCSVIQDYGQIETFDNEHPCCPRWCPHCPCRWLSTDFSPAKQGRRRSHGCEWSPPAFPDWESARCWRTRRLGTAHGWAVCRRTHHLLYRKAD